MSELFRHMTFSSARLRLHQRLHSLTTRSIRVGYGCSKLGLELGTHKFCGEYGKAFGNSGISSRALDPRTILLVLQGSRAVHVRTVALDTLLLRRQDDSCAGVREHKLY